LPDSETVWGEPVALSAIDSVPVTEFLEVGVNFTVVAQLAPAASVVVQVVVSVKPVPARVCEVIDKAAVPVFVMVTVWLEELPTVTLPKLIEVVLSVTTGAGATPVPVSETVCGEPVTLSPTVIVADREPATAGVNVTAMVHVPLIATLPEQAVVSVKSPELVPVTLTEVMVRTAVPVFLTVTVCAALDEPRATEPKLSEAGLNEMAGAAATPVPFSAMVCGEPVTLSPTVIDAESDPATAGVNVTPIVQVAFAARLVVQVVESVKLPEFVPVTFTEVMVSVAVPVFFTVTV